MWTLAASWTVAAAPEAPAELVKVRKAFAAAVTAKDEKRAESLTAFPFKNIVYRQPPTLGRAGFAKLFMDYRHMTTCIETAPLQADKADWLLDCDGNILRFGLRKGQWRHTGYENINE